MRLLIASDLHREFDGWQHFDPRAAAAADVVVLAGDIDLGEAGIVWAARHFAGKPIVYVAGNHEYYHGHWTATLAAMRRAASDTGVAFLEDDEVVIAGTRFVGATLWTDFALDGETRLDDAMQAARKVMADFELIRVAGASTPGEGTERLVAPDDMRRRFAASRADLDRRLRRPFDGPTVVVTHHLPHRGSIAERWLAGHLNAAFASDLSALIERRAPSLWVHGHAHDSADHVVGATRIVCNPKGYPQRDGTAENRDFDPGFTVTLA